jgi:hypothetical protein
VQLLKAEPVQVPQLTAQLEHVLSWFAPQVVDA